MTTNLPEAKMIASVGNIINFTDDSIRLFGTTFIGPVAEMRYNIMTTNFYAR